jgi:hypothetical protein
MRAGFYESVPHLAIADAVNWSHVIQTAFGAIRVTSAEQAILPTS